MANLLIKALIIGGGATLVFDLWGLVLNRVLGIPLPDWAMVGRWFGHLPAGRFHHADIAQSPPVPNELVLGWAAHYAVGISFALVTLAIGGESWLRAPSLALPLAVGLVTVGCGWFILQPGMGAGIAASKRPNAGQIRLLNIAAHTVFGVAMWVIAPALR